jgi:hypothetical protein
MRSIITGVVLSGLATAASAHHSGAMFDQAKTVTLAGTIKEYQFTNPHVWIEVLVPDAKGKPVQWSIEGEGPSLMARLGLKPKALQPGDKVTLKAHPLRDGRAGGSFITLTLGDGRVIGVPPRAPGAPAYPATAPQPVQSR